MLRYKTETRPGLVALHDIRPGNGAGQFLQPRSPHGALKSKHKAVLQNSISITQTQLVARLYHVLMLVYLRI